MEIYDQSSNDAIDQNCGEAESRRRKTIKEKGSKGIKKKKMEKEKKTTSFAVTTFFH